MLPREGDNNLAAQETPQVVETVTADMTTVAADSAELDRVGEIDVGNDGDVLVVGADSYDDVEVEGVQGDGADRDETVVDTLQRSLDIPTNSSKDQLDKATEEDTSLNSMKLLADREAEGYKWEEGLLFKYQLDQFGRSTRRLCVPLLYRDKCMVTARNKFGHRGKNKVARDLAQSFYWPSLWRDVAKHCRACKTCQEYSKAKPRHSPMVEREVMTVPSERVAIDVVGPLSKARGGCEYIITCIDVATRWPEAVAVGKVCSSHS